MCQEHLRLSPNINRQVGSITLFKKIWRLEIRLKEKRAMSHSKCDICKAIDVELQRLKGVPGEDAAKRRAWLLRARKEHEKRHLSCRSILDMHGFQAAVNPAAVWCIQCDAATAKNMELPRLNMRENRLPKKAAGTLPKFCLKLTATYCYGYGFIPFLSHDSLRHGPNLVWTVVWKSICRLYNHYGSYPDVLFILLTEQNTVTRASRVEQGVHRAWRALMRTPHGAWYDVFFSYSTIVVTYMSKTDPPGQCSVCVFQCVCSRTKHHLTNFMVSACYVFEQ